MTFYIVYGVGILIALIMTRSLKKANRELEEKNRAAREREREDLGIDDDDESASRSAEAPSVAHDKEV